MSIARHHNEWLQLVEVSGPFLSLPVLMRVLPQGLEAQDTDISRNVRLAFSEWEDSHANPAFIPPGWNSSWKQVLEYPGDYLAWRSGPAEWPGSPRGRAWRNPAADLCAESAAGVLPTPAGHRLFAEPIAESPCQWHSLENRFSRHPDDDPVARHGRAAGAHHQRRAVDAGLVPDPARPAATSLGTPVSGVKNR